MSQTGGPPVPTVGSNANGYFVNGAHPGGVSAYLVEGNIPRAKELLPRIVLRLSFNHGDVSNFSGDTKCGFRDTGATPLASTESIWFSASFTGGGIGQRTIKIERRVGGVSQTQTDTAMTVGSTVHYFVVEYTGPNDVTCTIYDQSFAVEYTTSFTGAPNVPQLTAGHGFLDVDSSGAAHSSNTQLYMAKISSEAF